MSLVKAKEETASYDRQFEDGTIFDHALQLNSHVKAPNSYCSKTSFLLLPFLI